jgi:hypothetical protein
MGAPRRPLLALIAVLAVPLAGCGSTVQVNGSAQVPGGGLDGLGNELGGSAAPGTTGSLLGGTSGTGSTGGSTGAISATGTSGTTGGYSVPTLPPGVDGPGVTATKVYVGIITDKGSGGLNSAVGVGAISSGDDDANTRAVLKDIKAHGGAGGREIVPVYGYFDQTSTETYDQQFAGLCQKFTRDQRVFAVVDAGIPDAASYRDCMSRAGIAIVSSNLPISAGPTFRQHPGYVELGSPNLDRLAAYLVSSLQEQHYFSPWNAFSGQPAPTGKAKVGVLTFDDRDYTHAVDTVLVPGLKRLGYDPMVRRMSQLSSASEVSGQAATVKAAQLAFASNRVTHVIPFETGGNLMTFFFPTAQAQAYYPRYGGNTGSAFEALLEAGAAQPQQLNGVVGYGWIPSIDLQSTDSARSVYANAGTRHCLKVMRDAGIVFDSGNAQGIALNTCSVFYLIKAALDRTPKQVTLGSFLQSLAGMGTSFAKPGGLGLDFQGGRPDPANKGYYFRYESGCNCMRYYGPLWTIP